MKKKKYALSKNRFFSPDFDALGSYTGVGLSPFETPEQDADDL